MIGDKEYWTDKRRLLKEAIVMVKPKTWEELMEEWRQAVNIEC